MFSNGSQPETGFPRRYKIAADVEFITSATIISSIRIILMDRVAFFYLGWAVGWGERIRASLTVIFICHISLFLRYVIEKRLRAV